ncbi:nucleotide-diphospho-sugar transferase [Mycena maculata]|uniref:Nucleotide-diphospho-sugar transferase n=1 Tax=Mycena maculata TaxID=230809 RepID=A0AAD7MQ60_9AGAR|nr:nucleotide-diphospho-sugar transferase [Mycena maculata]
MSRTALEECRAAARAKNSPKVAFVTLLTKVSYLAGALVLDLGLKDAKSKYPFVVMVTPELPQEGRDVLQIRGIHMREIQALHPEEGRHTLSTADARFHDTWTKAFELTEFDRVVLLDSDMVVKKNMDDLMEMPLLPGGIAAVHACACNPRKLPHYPADWIPENCAFTAVASPTSPSPTPSDNPRAYGLLNSGLVVLEPSTELAKNLYHFLATDERIPTFIFPDQDLLAIFFREKWTSLPWYYNALRTLRNIHPLLWEDDVAKCVHYILSDKPWQVRESKEFALVNSWWWAQYNKLAEQLQAEDVDSWKLVSSTVAA